MLRKLITVNVRGCSSITKGRVYISSHYFSDLCCVLDDYDHKRWFKTHRFTELLDCKECTSRKCNSCPISKETLC